MALIRSYNASITNEEKIIMDAKQLNSYLTVSGQITLVDITQLKNNGVKSIICNRPDNEDLGQIEHEIIAKKAKQEGIVFYFMPVVSGRVTLDDSKQFASLLTEAPHPIHAYCRSGTRCTSLWAIAEINAGNNREHVLQQAAQAGYDLSKIL
jgi:sulfide:quinone oxidoreductase